VGRVGDRLGPLRVLIVALEKFNSPGSEGVLNDTFYFFLDVLIFAGVCWFPSTLPLLDGPCALFCPPLVPLSLIALGRAEPEV